MASTPLHHSWSASRPIVRNCFALSAGRRCSHEPQAKISASPVASLTSRSQSLRAMREATLGYVESLPPLCGCSKQEIARLLPRSAGSSSYLRRGGRKQMKTTRSKTAVRLFDLAMLATIGGVSAGAFYGLLRLAIWLFCNL